MKRIWIPVISVLFLLVVIGWLNYNNLSSQKNVKLENDTNLLGEFPVINGLVSPAFHIPFLIDTSCDLSMIKPRAISVLKDRGYRVDSSYCPVFFRGVNGKLHFTTKRYTIDIPIQEWGIAMSNDGEIFYTCPEDEVVNVLHNVNFVPAVDNINVIGLDIIRRCAVEYKLTPGTVSFYKSAPEGYQTLCEVDNDYTFDQLIGVQPNYKLGLTISGRDHSYIIDSALDIVHVKMPAGDTIYAQSDLVDHSILTSNGALIKIREAEREWTFLGDRAGITTVSYFDDGDPYAINPFKFSSQDVLLDIPNNRLCYRPQYNVPGHIK